MLHLNRPNHRHAFTLVELLVSSAVILMMMYILASAFQSALTSFSQLKTAGDMQERLRQVSIIVRDDLKQQHFAGGQVQDRNNGSSLGEQLMNDPSWKPPEKGFFRIWQNTPVTGPGADQQYYEQIVPTSTDEPYSYRAVNQCLHFSNYLGGTITNRGLTTSRDQVYVTQFRDSQGLPDKTIINTYDPDRNTSNPSFVSPPYFRSDDFPAPSNNSLQSYTFPANSPFSRQGYFYSPWAEVMYFLKETGQTAGSTKLYALYRRQLLIVDDNAAGAPPAPPTSTPAYLPPSKDKPALIEMSFANFNGQWVLNQPGDVTVPQRRYGMDAGKVYGYPAMNPSASSSVLFPRYQTLAELLNPTNTTPAPDQAIDDLLLSDVLSCEIKADWDAPAGQTQYGLDARLKWPALNPYGPTSNVVTQNNSNPRPPYFIDNSGNPQPLNPDYPFDDLPALPNASKSQGTDLFSGARVFDSWSKVDTSPYQFVSQPPADPFGQPAWNSGYMVNTPGQAARKTTTIPLRMRIRALQIRIRIWDAKSQQTRQITIVQDM